MKALDKNNKVAKKDRESIRDKKEIFSFADYGTPCYMSLTSHKKTNKRK